MTGSRIARNESVTFKKYFIISYILILSIIVQKRVNPLEELVFPQQDVDFFSVANLGGEVTMCQKKNRIFSKV